MYRTFTYCTGYTIRRSQWKSKIFNDDHEDIASAFKRIIKKEYEETTMSRVMEEKQRFMKKWNDRCDYSGMLRVIYEDDHSHDEGGGAEGHPGSARRACQEEGQGRRLRSDARHRLGALVCLEARGPDRSFGRARGSRMKAV